jgi:hypothetical protein
MKTIEDALLGQLAADFRTHAGAQTGVADLDDVVGARGGQRLGVGVCGDELDTGNTFIDHVLHRVATSSANADDLDDGTQCCVIDHIELHDELLFCNCTSKLQSSWFAIKPGDWKCDLF